MIATKLRRRKATLFAVIAGVLFLTFILLVFAWIQSSKGDAKQTVLEFYRYEQEGDFANSWELFHSAMKDKFNKADYIQDRAHVFMNHFGVETFTFEIEDSEKIKSWTMTETSLPMQNVYRFEVIQTYKGKYGHFDLHQNVFTAKENGKWRILWDYHR
ncbi:hypothetical protein [Marinicrinis lubricantis]|uniref:DUF4440 domain-containing protein n=1 Tax=Marinicrinis lubricantis TaxID=2086470 RepID=A0ABW1INQ6_9BACL